MWSYCLLFLLLPLCCCNIINLEVVKATNVQAQTMKTTYIVIFKNYGPSTVEAYNFLLDPDIKDYHIEFYNATGQKLSYVKERIPVNDETHYKFVVKFGRPISVDETYKFEAELICLNKIKSLDKFLSFGHTVQYEGNLVLYTEYKTHSFHTLYNMKVKNIFSLSHMPSHSNGTTLTYAFDNLLPYSYKQVNVVYILEDPCYVVTNLERTIDVSHFGYISIEDKVEVVNKGPKLVGSYALYQPKSPQQLYTHLPASAENIKFFDEIGNNSKSNIIYYNTYTTLAFETRYPLLRSWKASYTLQYSVPTYEYLMASEDNYLLSMRVVDHVLPEAVIEYARVKVILPEASEIVTVNYPNLFNREDDEISVTSLTISRPTVVFNGRLLTEDSILYFGITYKRFKYDLYRPALYIFVYIETVFLFYIVISHLNFSIK